MQLNNLHGAFYGWLQGHSLSSGQIALWHAIAYMATSSGQKRIRISGIQLVQNTGLSYEGVQKARNVLKQHGLIDFTGGKGRKGTEYTLLGIPGTKNSTDMSTDMSTECGANARTKASDILNNNILLPPPQTPPPKGSFVSYVEDNLRGMTPGNWEALRSYMEDGITVEMVMQAVDEAAAYGQRSWAYVRSILDRWLREGVTTLEQAKGERRQPEPRPQRRRQFVTAPEGYE